MTCNRKKSGFTLIEMLVVIAIIAMLAALIVPLIGRAQEKAKRSTCRNNLKQMGLILIQHALDNGDQLVLRTPATDPMNNQWPFRDHIMILAQGGYLSDTRLLICASDKVDGATGQFDITPAKAFDATFDGFQNISYMYVAGYRIGGVEKSANAPVMCDESNEDEKDNITGDMPDITDADNHGDDFRNVLMLDGHVTAFISADAANAIFDNLK